MRNNIFKVVFALLLSVSSVFGADGIFTANDEVVDDDKFTCRAVDESKYITRIVAFIPETGTVYCEIADKNNHEKVIGESEQVHLGILKKLSNKLEAQKIDKKQQEQKFQSNIGQKNNNEKEITFVRFLTALVTLDPSVINFQEVRNTKSIGSSTLQNGYQLAGQATDSFSINAYSNRNSNLLSFNPLTLPVRLFEQVATGADAYANVDTSNMNAAGKRQTFRLGEYETASAADGINKANLVYFIELFNDMNEIYKHLQNLLFIVIGGWFVGTIGTQKLLKYLENKGEGSGGNQPYLHKFLIPILGVSFFFAPIPEGNLPNQSTTIVQNVIRYFTATGNQIADMASNIGMKTYVNKLYNRVGGMSQTQEIYLTSAMIIQKHNAEEHHRLFEEICRYRFVGGNGTGGIDTILDEIANREITNREDIVGQFKPGKQGLQDITADACVASFKLEPEATRNAEQYKTQLSAANKFAKNNKLQEALKNIDNYIANKAREFGWFQSVLIPGTGLMVEVQDYITENSVQNEKNGNNAAAMAKKSDVEAIQHAQQAKTSLRDKTVDVIIDELFQQLVYFILPGSGNIRKLIQDISDQGISIVSYLSFAGGPLAGILSTLLGKVVNSLASPIASFFLTIQIMKSILLYMPAVVGTLAGTIAFLSYIVGLCKYFYISPFVVAFSITTKRQEKIIDFLLSGVSIFFKPILIVLFIYLSLFLYTFTKDIVLVISESQFNILRTTDINFGAAFAIGAIKALFNIFTSIASCYIMWKLIIKGPDWVMDLIGIKGGQDTIVADSMTQQLERRAMMVH